MSSARSQGDTKASAEPAFDQSVSARSGYVSDRRSEASMASSAARPQAASNDGPPRVAFAASTTGGASIAGGSSSSPSTARSMLSTARSGLSSTASSRAPVDTSKGYFPRPDSAGSASLSAALAGEQKEQDDSQRSASPADSADDAASAPPATATASATAAALTSPAPVTKVNATAKPSPSGSPSTTTPKKRVASATRSSPSSRPSTATAAATSSSHSTPVRAAHHYPKAAAAEPAAVVRGTDFAFPLGDAPAPRKSSSAGVFKSFFSPNAQHSHAAYSVYATAHGAAGSPSALEQDSQARVPAVAAPMGEFPLSPGTTNVRAKQMDTQARKAAAARREEEAMRSSLHSSGSSSRISSRPGTAAGRDSSPLRGSNPRHTQSMSYSASAAQLPYSSSAASTSATASPQHSSFARRMIHAQSAAELALHSPVQAQQLDDDPDSSSLYFEGRNPGMSAADQEESRRLQDLHNGTQGGGGSGSTLLVPYAANATNSYAAYSPSPASSQQPQQARPNTAGVSSSGIAWSSKLTGPIPEERQPSPSKAARPLTSSGLRGKPPPTLPSELMVGVADMPAHMQRDHAALARLIANLEPAGRGSLAGATVFSKLSTSSSRDALFNGKKSAYQDPSQIMRLEQGSASDDLLRKRSIQKGIENQRQSSSALASRGAAGLAGNNLNGRAVAEAVAQTNADYPITDERPRNSRPATAHASVGVAAALAAAGSPGAAEIIGATVASVPQPQQRKQLRPSTSSGGRPSTASSSRLSASESSPLLLIPGISSFATRGDSAGSVLGFSGSIDRFGGSVEEMRFQGATTSATGGRGMMASKSAQKLLAGVIPTAGAGAGAAGEDGGSGSGQGSKRFNSLALEFEVALRERLVRIAPKKSSASSTAAAAAAPNGTQALERLDVFRTLLDDIILHSPVFGGLLAKVKAEYESYVRGGESAAAAAAGDDLRAPRASAANANHQAIEDTLVLENHRLHSKLHGFQRAYTSLYAKYKSLLHQQKIQEGILSQNALVLNDLNAQLQAAVLASMSDEERHMEALRKEGFKLENETEDDAREIAARKQRLAAVGTLPDLGLDDDDEDEAEDAKADANPSSEAARRKAHAKKVARAKKAAAALLKAQSDPLEHGRQLMRQFQRPAGYAAPISALANAAETDELEAEGAPIDPLKLAAFIEAGLGPSAGPGRNGGASGNPNDPASMLSEDPLEDLAQVSRRQLLAARAEARRLADELLSTQTLLEQSRTKEIQARMTMEEFSKQRYEFEKKQAAAAAAAAQQAAVSAQKAQQQQAKSRPASFDSAAAVHAIPAHAMLANISAASPSNNYASSPPVIPALPLQAIAPGNSGRGSNYYPSQQHQQQQQLEDDDDPDNVLADDGGDGGEVDGGLSEKDRVLAELQFQRQLVDSRMGIAAAEAAAAATAAAVATGAAAVIITPAASPSLSPAVPVSRVNSALLHAATEEEEDLATLSEQTEPLTRKTSRSAYTLTGTVAEDNWFD